MHRLLDITHPSELGGWETVVGPFIHLAGWTFFGDLLLRNPADGHYALLAVSPPKFVPLRFNNRESIEREFLSGRFMQRRLRPADVQALEQRLGVPGTYELFAPAALPPPEERDLSAYQKVDVRRYAALAAARYGIGSGGVLDLLLRHLRWNDDAALWRVAAGHILSELDPKPGTLVQVGRCSHWLRPHQTRWTADGGFAWPTGYGSGGGGYSRDALPRFDWSVVLVWAGERWTTAEDKSARPALRVTIPSRTERHRQAAVHTIRMTEREKEWRFYGFRWSDDDEWRCTAESDWREDRPPGARGK